VVGVNGGTIARQCLDAGRLDEIGSTGPGPADGRTRYDLDTKFRSSSVRCGQARS
jgi:hypothetical protein